MKLLHGYRLLGLLAVLIGLLSGSAARADEILVANYGANTIGAYTMCRKRNAAKMSHYPLPFTLFPVSVNLSI